MKKTILKGSKTLLILVILIFSFVKNSYAATNNCTAGSVSPNPIINSGVFSGQNSEITYKFELQDNADLQGYYTIKADNGTPNTDYIAIPFQPHQDPTSKKYIIDGVIKQQDWASQFALSGLYSGKEHTLTLYRLSSQNTQLDPNRAPLGSQLTNPYCDSLKYSVIPAPTPTSVEVNCELTSSENKPTTKTPITINFNTMVSDINQASAGWSWKGVLKYSDIINSKPQFTKEYVATKNNNKNSYNLNTFDTPTTAHLTYEVQGCVVNFLKNCPTSWTILKSCELTLKIGDTTGEVITPSPPAAAVCPSDCLPYTDCTRCSACYWCPKDTTKDKQPISTDETLCRNSITNDKIENKEAKLQACINCAKDKKLWTAIGCIPTKIEDVINQYLFTTGIGIVGGVAFLYLLYGCFLILTSAGNPEQIAQAREIITSSIMGLLLAIFSVFILRILTVDILQLPDFK